MPYSPGDTHCMMTFCNMQDHDGWALHVPAGPPGTNYAVMRKAFEEGWGAVIAKTVSMDSSKVDVPSDSITGALQLQLACVSRMQRDYM